MTDWWKPFVDWWLDCPLWKPFVDWLRRWPRPEDVITPPPSVWQKRTPYRGLVALMFIFGVPLWLLSVILKVIF